MRTWTGRDNGARGFMSGRYRRSLKELRSFRAAKGIGVYPEQELTGSRFRHCFFDESDFFVPDKRGNPAGCGNGIAHSCNESVEG